MKNCKENYDERDHLRKVRNCLRGWYRGMTSPDTLGMTCIMTLAEADVLISSVCDVLDGKGSADTLQEALDSVRLDLVAQEVILKNLAK